MSRGNLTRARALVISAVAGLAWACAENVTPGSPTPATSSGISELTTVTICHRTEGSGTFTKTDIPAASTATHFAHGDAFPGHFVPGNSALRLDQACATTAVVGATIAFKDLKAHGAPITIYQESGFRISAETGPWEESTTYGSPAPMVIFKRPAASDDTTGKLRLHSGSGLSAGGLFAFTSVDLYSSVTPIPYTIAGYLDSREVLALTATLPNTFGKLVKVTNPNPPQMLDLLFIHMVNPATKCCSNPVGLDNIVLKR